MAAMGILLGGHVGTGLEDVINYERGVPASNEMLVSRIVRIAGELGREIADTDEARAILQL